MLEKLTEEEFNNYAKRHPNNIFFQSSYWGKLKETTGWKHYMIGFKDNKIRCATLLLAKHIPILNHYIFYAPRGFLIDYSDTELLNNFTKELVKFIKKEKGIFLKINPNLVYQERNINGDIVENGINNKQVIDILSQIGFKHNGFTITYGKDLEPRWISVLDLKNKSEEELLKEMRSTTRLAVNSSYKHGLELEQINNDQMDEFKKLMLHTGERRGFIDRPLSYYKNLNNSFKDNIKIMLVKLNVKKYLEEVEKEVEEIRIQKKELDGTTGAKGKRKLVEIEKQIEVLTKKREDLKKLNKVGDKIVVAGGLFMTYGTQVLSLFGASYKEYMKYNGQYLLNFEMMKYAINNGYEKYNFYGITGEFNEKSPMYGLFDFKRGFNSKVVELIGEFTIITNGLYNNLYNTMFGVYKKIKKLKVKK